MMLMPPLLIIAAYDDTPPCRRLMLAAFRRLRCRSHAFHCRQRATPYITLDDIDTPCCHDTLDFLLFVTFADAYGSAPRGALSRATRDARMLRYASDGFRLFSRHGATPASVATLYATMLILPLR